MKVYFEQVYENIGYLFYAIAANQGKLQRSDYNKLTQLVDSKWVLPSPGNVLNGYFTDYLYAGLRTAFDNLLSADKAYKHFMNYYYLHRTPFSPSLKEKILETANLIVAEFPANDTKGALLPVLEKTFAGAAVLVDGAG